MLERNENKEKTKVVSGGPGALTLLQAAFIFCKCAGITNIASWGWGLVLVPTWIGLGILGVALIVALIIGIIAGVMS